jgi:hypothetical protein
MVGYARDDSTLTARYTSTPKKSYVDVAEAERRLMAYNCRVFSNPALSPLLGKKANRVEP